MERVRGRAWDVFGDVKDIVAQDVPGERAWNVTADVSGTCLKTRRVWGRVS